MAVSAHHHLCFRPINLIVSCIRLAMNSTRYLFQTLSDSAMKMGMTFLWIIYLQTRVLLSGEPAMNINKNKQKTNRINERDNINLKLSRTETIIAQRFLEN